MKASLGYTVSWRLAEPTIDSKTVVAGANVRTGCRSRRHSTDYVTLNISPELYVSKFPL